VAGSCSGLAQPRGCLAGLLPLSSAGGSLPVMLNGLLAHGNAQGYQQQQQGSSQPALDFLQQGTSIATPAMIAAGSNAQPPTGVHGHHLLVTKPHCMICCHWRA
jgi:hypothetical protein